MEGTRDRIQSLHREVERLRADRDDYKRLRNEATAELRTLRVENTALLRALQNRDEVSRRDCVEMMDWEHDYDLLKEENAQLRAAIDQARSSDGDDG